MPDYVRKNRNSEKFLRRRNGTRFLGETVVVIMRELSRPQMTQIARMDGSLPRRVIQPGLKPVWFIEKSLAPDLPLLHSHRA